MQHWEYDSTEPYELGKLMDVLDEKGKRGWELVTIIDMTVRNKKVYVAILKRCADE